MIRSLALPFAAAITALLLPAAVAVPLAAAAPAPVLKEQIHVHGDVVTLGDLFENAGPAAATPVFRAPDLGTEGIVAGKRIATAAARHGLVWTNPGELDTVVVRRPSRMVSLKEIEQAVRQAAAAKMGLEDAAALDITLASDARPLQLDARTRARAHVRRLVLQPRSGTFQAVLSFDDAPQGEQTHAVRGRAIETVAVPVPARKIAAGTAMSDADIRIIRIPAARIPRGIVRDRAKLVGMASKRVLRAGQPVRAAELQRPTLVRKNTLVAIVYRVPGLVLRVQGRALADAAMGEAVSVVNAQSKRTIQATVAGEGLVTVVAAPNLSLAQPTPRQTAARSTSLVR